MISVFLVEDEFIVREGIKNINWEAHGLSFVGEASDGELAFPLIKKEASGYCNYRYMHAFYGRIGVKPFDKKRAATDKDFDFKWT